jgi:hypothetical protein
MLQLRSPTRLVAYRVTTEAGVVQSDAANRQFVNLRMRTLSTSPKPARVAIMDDPP